MSQFFTLLTKTGQGLLANAIAYGQPLTIATMAIGDGGGKLPTPDASTTRLINEVRRGPINQTTTDPNNPNWTVVEQVLPPDVGGWTIREVGLYDTEGNLIAYGNYPETYKPQLSEGSSRTQTIRFIMEVTDTSAVTLRIDPSVVMASRKYVDDAMAAHEKSRNHPAADTKNSGMMRFATLAESKKGEEAKAAQTPAGGKAQLDDHRAEKGAHKASQIALDNLLSVFGNAGTVQAVLAALGTAALKTVGDNAGDVMTVGAHGWGGNSVPTPSTNFDRIVDRTALYTLANQYTNGPSGGSSQTYTGQMLVLRRQYTAGVSVVQIAYINGNDAGRWERYSSGWNSTTDLPTFGPWQKAATMDEIDGLSRRQIRTGAGLTGGGDLSSDRTISVPNGGITFHHLANGAGEGDWVKDRLADRGYVNHVGTYALLSLRNSGSVAPGSTTSGSNLRYVGIKETADGFNFWGNPAGTWRCMGYVMSNGNQGDATLFLRIS